MSSKRCPKCDQLLMATMIRVPTAITIHPCSHQIDHITVLIDAPALDPPSPGEWVTEFLAAADDN